MRPRSASLIFLSMLLAMTAVAGPSPKKRPAAPQNPEAPPLQTPTPGQTIVYLTQESESADQSSEVASVPSQNPPGFEGALLGIEDDNTTGRFTGQTFTLRKVTIKAGESPVTIFKSLLEEGLGFFLVDLGPETLLSISRLPEASNVLLFDLRNSDDLLRGAECEPNLFFLMPSNAMRADALSQYFGKKRWQKWFLAVGKDAQDLKMAEAIRHSAKKFGAKIVADKIWNYSFEDRKTPESEIPVFTQAADYDVLMVADYQESFIGFLPYRTWLPRPIAGSGGLSALAWHPGHDLWGALQLQSRFTEKTQRPMHEKDYTAWLGARIIGEAATRTRALNVSAIASEILSGEFSIAGFKGVPLSFRAWDHQLRQPVLLATSASNISVAPIEGYLHPTNTLDTLGFDRTESRCSLKSSAPAITLPPAVH